MNVVLFFRVEKMKSKVNCFQRDGTVTKAFIYWDTQKMGVSSC